MKTVIFISNKHQNLRVAVGNNNYVLFNKGEFKTIDIETIKALLNHPGYKHQYDTPGQMLVITMHGDVRDTLDFNDDEKERFVNEDHTVKNVTIIIGTRYNPDNLRNCLMSLYKSTPLGFKLIVINNQASDESQKVIDSFRKVFGKDMMILKNKINKSFAEFNNQGIKLAKTKYICYLNDDTILRTKWLQSMIHIIENYQDCGAVGKMATTIDKKTMQLSETGTKSIESEYVFAYCMLVRRKDARFDERYKVAGWEDIDHCEAIKEKGYVLCVEREYPIIHLSGESTMKKTPHVMEIYAKNEKLYNEKWVKKKVKLFHV